MPASQRTAQLVDADAQEALQESARIAQSRESDVIDEDDLAATLQTWRPDREDVAAQQLLAALSFHRAEPLRETRTAEPVESYRSGSSPEAGTVVARVIDDAATEFGARRVGRRELAWALVGRDSRRALGAAAWLPRVRAQLLISICCLVAGIVAATRGALTLVVKLAQHNYPAITKYQRAILPALIVGCLSLLLDTYVVWLIGELQKTPWVNSSRRQRRRLWFSKAAVAISFLAFGLTILPLTCVIIS